MDLLKNMHRVGCSVTRTWRIGKFEKTITVNLNRIDGGNFAASKVGEIPFQFFPDSSLNNFSTDLQTGASNLL